MSETTGTNINERQSVEYWNKRALAGGSPLELVYASTHFNEFDKNTRQILGLFKGKKVLDVGCGYGRMSDMFEDYLGIDFSEEMIKLAIARYPGKRFEVAETSYETFDVVFEVMCLSSLGLTPKEFAEKYKAPIVICFEPYEFNIFYK